ncbi:MAG: hypothetical protein K2X77_01505 [Candidatus Obscuribacterales bacterium]|nr:hypothetical protein [Candidatus Obscuribacterales bacterium]
MGDRHLVDDKDLLSIPQKEGINELAGEFARSLAYGAIQGPVDGIAQLVDKSTGSNLLPSLHVIDHPEEKKFGTAQWHAQQIGGAIGMAVPLLAMHRIVTKFSGNMAEQCATSEASKLASNCFSSELRNSAITGALYGGILTPADAREDFASARLKSAATGGITFGAFSAGSFGVKALTSRIVPAVAETGAAKILSAMAAGIPAGALSAQTDSILHGRGNATHEEVLRSAYSFALVGGTLTYGHSLLPKPISAKSAEAAQTPGETKAALKQGDQAVIEATDTKLVPTRADQATNDAAQKCFDAFKRPPKSPPTEPILCGDNVARNALPVVETGTDQRLNDAVRITDPVLIKGVQSCFDAFKRPTKEPIAETGTNNSQAQFAQEQAESVVQSRSRQDSSANGIEPAELIDPNERRAAEKVDPIDEPISIEAQALLDRYQKALDEHKADSAVSINRQESSSSSKGVRLADVWVKNLPEDAFTIAGKDRSRYWQYISRKFESRAIWNEISQKRQAETFVQLERLLKPQEKEWTSSVKPLRLRQLARETLENVSNPYGIDQGDHPTCVLNSIENVIASNHPEKYARLVADLGLTGESYKNGVGLKLPERCMIPDTEAKQLTRKDNSRCYASQLTQYYLANLHWSEGGELPTGDFADAGTVVYQPVNAGRNRAGLYVDGKLLKTLGKQHGKEGSVYVPLEAPEISDNYIVPLFRKVVPRGQIKVIDHFAGIDKFTDDSGKRTVTTVSKPDDLEQALLTSKRGSVICGVRSEQLGGDNGWHAVVIRDFDADSGTVSLDNSWGRAAEHSGRKGQRNRLSIKDLFKLMEPPTEEAE